MAKDFTVTVSGERGQEFKDIFGTATVHVLLPFPYMAQLDGCAEPQAVYMLDADQLGPEQYDRLVLHLARKFASSEAEIRRYLRNEGLPIRAADTVVSVEHPQRWLLDDDDTQELVGYDDSEADDDCDQRI